MRKEEALQLLASNYSKLESPIAFANDEVIYEYFKDSLSRKDISKFLQSVPTYTKTRKFVNKFKRNYVYTPRKRYLLQTDLKDISNLSKFNKNFKFILGEFYSDFISTYSE